jgi:DNA (cytosine-5)-methyltransferase 1
MIRPDELIVDNFAGGGGASSGIEAALGRPIDIAINHDPEAIAMHRLNHPRTRHLCEDVFSVDIVQVTEGCPVGLAWFSPDCKHFSKAKGGKPVSKNIRGLAWVAVKWAQLKRPRVIMLENVEEFQTWGPLLEDGMPDPGRSGLTFKRWVSRLRNLGYSKISWRELRGCDYGAPTIRKRLVLVARCDGREIAWPDKSHGPDLTPYRTAADCIDWSLPCPSIFLSKAEGRAIGVNRPLADATMRRIAKGVKRYVLDAASPFIVPIAHYNGSDTVQPISEPLRTITANPKGGSHALVMPFLATYYGANREGGERTASIADPLRTQSTENRHGLVSAFLSRQFGKSVGSSVEQPIGATTAGGGGKSALVTAFLAQHNGGMVGHDVRKPLSTITMRGTNQAVIASSIVKLRGTNVGHTTNEPLHTVSAGGTHLGGVRAFLMKYYGVQQDPRLEEPMHTIPTRGRFALVMVHGEPYVITDIGMRMLAPRELFRAQGFRESYIIDGDGLSKTAQVRMCGNSVCPDVAEAVVRAQFGGGASREVAA